MKNFVSGMNAKTNTNSNYDFNQEELFRLKSLGFVVLFKLEESLWKKQL